jgi:hypothetical protein
VIFVAGRYESELLLEISQRRSGQPLERASQQRN